MFETLVVSTKNRRGARTPAIFAGTAAAWLGVLAAVTVVGILTYDARVSAEGNDVKLVALPPPTTAPPPPASDATVTRQPASVARVMESHPTPPTAVHAPEPHPAPPSMAPPGIGVHGGNPFSTSLGDGDPNGIADGPGPGDTVARNTTPAPPPPAPPAPEPAAKPDVDRSRPISKGPLAGHAIRRVEPPYPPVARAAGIHGAVIVEVTVSEDGAVMSAHAISGSPALRAAAENAARGWRFTPTMLGGVAVKVVGTITFDFKLS